MPWKNGLGVTQEIYKEVDFSNEMIFRISKAFISTDSAFSIFNNYQRIISILNGNGVYLNDLKLNKQDSPYYFSGDTEIYSKLIEGPVEDFNVIWRPELFQINLEILKFEKKTVFSYKLSDENEDIMLYLKYGSINEQTSEGLYFLDNFIKNSELFLEGCIYLIKRRKFVKSV